MHRKEFDLFVKEKMKQPEEQKRVKLSELEEPIQYVQSYRSMCRPLHWTMISHTLKEMIRLPFDEAMDLRDKAIRVLRHGTFGDTEFTHRLLKETLKEVKDAGVKRLFEMAPPGVDEQCMLYGVQIVTSIMTRRGVKENWGEELFELLTS